MEGEREENNKERCMKEDKTGQEEYFREKKTQQGENERQQDAEEERREGHEGEKHVAGVKRRGSGVPLLHSPTVELEGLSHLSISNVPLCLSFQTLAQRISEAHAHASANKHTAQSDPRRYRHALILTAKVLKM